MTKITIYNVQSTITPKVGEPQLLFLCFAPCLMVVNISVKFRKNISNCFQVTKQTGFCDRQTDVYGILKGVDIIIALSRVIDF